jgi:hypothetical protein
MTATESNFTREEWSKILQSVVMAGMAVTAAEPSGLWGLLKESIASGRALIEAGANADSNELIKKVAADFRTPQGKADARDGLQKKFAGCKPSEIRDKAIGVLREVSSLLDAKAGNDAQGFKTWLLHIANEAATASKEGGFLGIGGVRVSEAEKATLADISHVLQITFDEQTLDKKGAANSKNQVS